MCHLIQLSSGLGFCNMSRYQAERTAAELGAVREIEARLTRTKELIAVYFLNDKDDEVFYWSAQTYVGALFGHPRQIADKYKQDYFV